MVSDIKSLVAPIPISSIGNMLDVLMEHHAHERRMLWYRGHRSTKWNVEATIWRRYGPEDERNFAHRFRSRAAIRMNAAPRYGDHAHWISLMRHYGLPTRLMDWSRSPLVALYFALGYLFEESPDPPEDSVVWVLDPHRLNKIENVRNIGNLTPSINSATCDHLIQGAFYADVIEPEKIIAVMAHDVDMRIFVQQGCFTIHSSRDPLNKRRDHAEFLFPLLIAKNHAKKMADQLFTAGLRRGDIYPDLSNLAAELVNTYSVS